MARTRVYRILMAEDSAADVRLVRMALDEQDFECSLTVAADGAQAIADIEQIDRDSHTAGLDLLLLDMHLPKRGGEEILRCLRSTERCAQTPVIVMTSSEAEKDHDIAERHAAYHYFRKPSGLAEFMKLGGIVREILTRKNQEGHAP